MKIKNSLLVLTISSLLIGCGSSSGGGSNVPQPDNSNLETPTPESSHKIVSHLIENGNLHGNLVSTSEQLDTMKKVEYKDISSIVIDGKRIELDDAEKITRLPNQKFYENTLAGFYADNRKEFFFSGGKLTPENEIPLKGSATYEGKFLGKTITNGKDERLQERSNVYLRVDFNKKFITGHVSYEDIEADISGNTFKGDKKRRYTVVTGTAPLNVKSNAHIEGAFYGSDTSEVAGSFSYEEEKKYEGVIDEKTKKFGVFQATKD